MKKKVNEVTDLTEKRGLEELEESVEMLDLHEMGDLRRDVEVLREQLLNKTRIDQNLYVEYDVKRGLRDAAGKGVLTGLTEISDVCAYQMEGERKIPSDGRLYYHGVNVIDLVEGLKERKFGFEASESKRAGHVFTCYVRNAGPWQSFCPRCHHEGIQCQYHERIAALCAYLIYVRFQSG